MKFKSKTIKRDNGKCDLTITFTTQQLLAILAKIDSKHIDKYDLNNNA